ncbi:protein cramped-like isoform X1 [Gadus morhua]|uniref:protein cramped-like isoform X1 n=2 Tax=Gadus morhua TaxID=8049 RepID=UPI0011B7188C|nr:protein cramped-like isoform X1 [Gadus morhua]
MVKRKKSSSATEEPETGMTLGSREGIGVDGRRNSSRKPEGCEEEEDGETGSEDRDTKGDGAESLHPSTAGSPGLPGPVPPGPVLTEPGPGSAPPPLTSTEPTPPSHDQHHFLRSSVRPPSKRIRKDSVGPAGDGPGGSRSRGAEGGSSSQGASGPSGSAAGAAAGGVSKASRGPADKEEQAGNQKRARRQWESWSAEDKNSFFEGLYEHGKDFEAIQNNIAMKYKKRGKPANMVKNKEQVRHFYYRTWHKISKHIDFANVYTRVLKKSSQELYGLICYAELRKKVGGLMDDKNVTKLNELIQNGATTVRSKGRNLRIKAPMCRALKKLCDPDGMSEEEDQRPARLPLKVAVELQPRTNHSWARVQSLAHNPRLRMMVELHRTVASLIEYLKHKWAFHDERILKSLREREALEGPAGPGPTPPGRPRAEELFLYPAECSTVTALPGVARVVHSKASCTVHWQESGRARPGGGARPGAKDLQTAQILGIHGPAPPPRGGPRAGRGADPRRAEPPPASDPPAEPGGDERKAPPPVAPPPSQTSSGPKVEAGNGEGPDAWAGPPEETGGGPPGAPSPGPERRPCGGVEDTPAAAPSPDTKPPGARGEEGGAPRPPSALEEKERLAEAIREGGWSVGGADGVTLAELYLMLGRPSKLQLEYEWQPAPPPPDPAPAGPPAPQPRPPSANRVLRCLLRLVATEVNPKPLAPEQGSSAPSPLKLPQEEQSGALTPPGKGPAPAVRSPGCGRQPPSLRGPKALLPNAAAGGRHLPRSLLGAAPGGDQEGGVFAIPTTLPPNSSRHSRMFSPNKEAQLAFRQQLDSISMQSDLFLAKQKKPRSRQLRKPLVVQRTLLPRTTGDTPPHVCSFSILSNSPAAGTGSFRPIQTRLAPTSRPLPSKASPANPSLSRAIDLAAKSAGIIPASPSREGSSDLRGHALLDPAAGGDGDLRPDLRPDPGLLQHNGPESGPPPPRGRDPVLPPPSVASLLDISLPGPPEESMPPGDGHAHISDSIIELAINSSHFGEDSALSSTKLGSSNGSKLLAASPPGSPSHGWIPSPSHDPQWYPSDSSDSTLGCLLSSLVSPDKGRRPCPSGPSSGTALLGPSLLDCNSHDSFQSRGLPDVAEMDSQLACMMSESSVDYIARFNDLAQELAVTEPSHPPPP